MNFTSIQSVYGKMSDDLSRKIYEDRLLYSITNDIKHIQKIVKTTDKGSRFLSKLKNISEKGIAIFGTGIWGKEIYKIGSGLEWKYWIDNNPKGDELYGIPVKSFENFAEMWEGEYIVISSRIYRKEMFEQLQNAGVPKEKIINAGQILDEFISKQYFDLEYLPKTHEREVFVDAGGFDGMSSVYFNEWCHGKGFAYIFEPDNFNIKKCQQNLEKHNVLHSIIEKGLWSNSTHLYFEKKSSSMSCLSDKATDNVVDVISLDEALRNEKITFIKMDIEGAEKEALIGAEEVISRNKPKLAISIYHKPEDIIELPDIILSYYPGYKFFLRHYSLGEFGTVLYAVSQ